MAGTYNHPMAGMGQMDDTMMAHVAPGEQIVPKPVLDANPQLAYYIARAIREAGVDPKEYQVGNEEMAINPYTGQPEFGFISKIWKKVKKVALPVAAIAAPLLIPGVGAAISGALGSLGTAGTVLGGASKVLSAFNLAQGLFGSGGERKTPKEQAINPAQAATFTPKRPDAMTAPNELAGFAPEQARSALATRGLNAGLGKTEQDYYTNLLQRSLIGEGGEVDTKNPNFLLPIESQYFSGQGKNTSDPMEFLRSLQS